VPWRFRGSACPRKLAGCRTSHVRDKWAQGACRLLTLLAAAHAQNEMIPLADLTIARDPSREELPHPLIADHCETGNRSAAVSAHPCHEEDVYADPYGRLSERMKELGERVRGG